MNESIRNFGLGPRIGLGATPRAKAAERTEAELIKKKTEKIKKLPVREQEKMLEELREDK